ncbi:MAG: hypothetical protein HKM24_00815 [Gammaproteobacteria bacterium]|nr:hypothetical protein [Gammaproteobacteria bacterium]
MLKPGVVAWKTGTSYGFRDAWAIGMFDHYVLAVWVGNFDNESNPAFVGRSTAGPLLFEMIQSLRANLGRFDDHSLTTSDGLNVRRIDVCEPTGDLPGRHCPRTKEAWFIPGVSPIKVSNVHQAIPIDIATGKRACKWNVDTTLLKVYEFWPSDVARLFRLAGAPRRPPPPYLDNCDIETKTTAGKAPKITSPQKTLTYHIREHNLQSERVLFEAVSDADSRFIHWFVDDRYVGKADAGQPLFWPPSLGEFTVRAVDDLGRAAATSLRVRLVQ